VALFSCAASIPCAYVFNELSLILNLVFMNLPEKCLLIDGNQEIFKIALNQIAPEVHCAIAFNGLSAPEQLRRNSSDFQDFIAKSPGIKQLAEILNDFFKTISSVC
jgi:hypothetical protein